MNLIRKALTTLGGVFLAALLIAALAPKAAHGVAAALVQVTNTATNAVPTEDGPGNFPFGATLCSDLLNTNCAKAAFTPVFVVPLTTSTGAAVKRLVIEEFSAQCAMDQGDMIFASIIVPLPADNVTSGVSDLQYHFPITVFGPQVGGPTNTVLGATHSSTRIYADPGDRIEARVSGVLTFTSNGASCNNFLSGHLETK